MGIKQSLLIQRIRRAAHSLQWVAAKEFLVETRDGRKGLIDSFLTKQGTRHRIAVEVELQGRRLERDVGKSEAARATECWIVVPNKHVADAAKRRLRQVATTPYTPAVYVLTVPEAVKALSNYSN